MNETFRRKTKNKLIIFAICPFQTKEHFAFCDVIKSIAERPSFGNIWTNKSNNPVSYYLDILVWIVETRNKHVMMKY